MRKIKIEASEVKNLVEYEKVREAMRSEVIALKRHRRISIGDKVTLLFENRATILFQIQEMIRTERIVDDDKIQAELDAYNGLLLGPEALSATLFLEIPDLARMNQQQVHEAVNRFQGLDREAVWLKVGAQVAIPARFEGGHSKEEKMAAVQYLRFDVSPEASAALADDSLEVRLTVEHPNYKAEAKVPAPMRAQLLADLGVRSPA